ncbi:nuclear transport factor 2 family protein [Naasia sp. SYSU D00057]|uniref:nuclear transport factor 2 family protein n=1 Tax=Naasia sp. SYSU D00057 TaxID=2817380 RepID=UPI001B315E84|nr:nuclear transport factor 2 family protein [Naasia sp. SYSU D00057]
MALVTSTLDSVIVVWHVAVNAGDAEAAAAACTEDVEMTSSQGPLRGRDEMSDWVRSSGIKLMPKEAYDVPGGIVVAQEATWPARSDMQPTRLYTAFGLRDGSISGVYPYGSLEEARAHPVAA